MPEKTQHSPSPLVFCECGKLCVCVSCVYCRRKQPCSAVKSHGCSRSLLSDVGCMQTFLIIHTQVPFTVCTQPNPHVHSPLHPHPPVTFLPAHNSAGRPDPLQAASSLSSPPFSSPSSRFCLFSFPPPLRNVSTLTSPLPLLMCMGGISLIRSHLSVNASHLCAPAPSFPPLPWPSGDLRG